MSWEKVKLNDICISIADGDHQPPPKTDKGIPFVTIANITKSNQFDFSDTMFVSREYYDSLDCKRKAKKDDILYSVVGSFGIPVYIKEEVPFVFQRHIAILRPNKERIIPQFLYYTMLSKSFYMQADAVAVGAAQRTVSLTALRNMEIQIPKINIQEKIVKILSAYDDLIENNQKQIKLLEEAAQRLYKEWFVDLRFQGHENTKIVDGVPEGWEKKPIDDVFTIKYGKTLSTSKITKTGSYPVYGANGVIGFYKEKNCDGYTTLITSRGNGSGDVLRTYHKEAFITNNSFIVKPIKEYNYCKVQYTYYLMKSFNFKAICTGSAQPQLTNTSISILNVILPSKKYIDMFCKLTEPILCEIRILLEKIENATQARDRLLPKLMSGELGG